MRRVIMVFPAAALYITFHIYLTGEDRNVNFSCHMAIFYWWRGPTSLDDHRRWRQELRDCWLSRCWNTVAWLHFFLLAHWRVKTSSFDFTHLSFRLLFDAQVSMCDISSTGQMLFLTPNQQCQSTEGTELILTHQSILMQWSRDNVCDMLSASRGFAPGPHWGI